VAARRGFGLVLLIVVAGLVVGSLLGELLGSLATGWLQDFLTKGPTIGLTPPVTVDLRLLAFTLGVAFKVNVVGVVGILISALTLRRL
jgi:Domain of unknown function (DUF4321)